MVNSSLLSKNLAEVQERIRSAARRSGREADDVALVAVTKYVTAEHCRSLLAAGCRRFGESRPQALWEKSAELQGTEASWDLIGQLQRNKVRRTLPLVELVHSGDRLRLLRQVHTVSEELGIRTRILLEVNISNDESKHGFAPADMDAALEQVSELTGLRVQGLMAMASRSGGVDQARRDFAALRELRDRLRTDCPAQVSLAELSMGMSGDFEVAIEEGATIVRVGSALFQGIA